MFTVDGVEWAIPCDIERKANVTESDISGMLLNRRYYADVIGTYPQYQITLVPNPAAMADYYALLAVLRQPVGEHTFILPHDGSTITIHGRTDGPQDVYVRRGNGVPYWKGTRFTVTSNEPLED